MEQTANFNAHSPLVLALDVGTSSTRALLFAATGAIVPGIQAQETYELTTSHEGEISVDADKLVAAVASTIDKTLKAAGPLASSIGAVATDTFWHSLVGVGADGRPLTPVITWEDTRPRQAAAELGKQLDNRAIHERTGARLHASYWPAKLRWLATTQPEVFKRVAHWLSFGEYLHLQFLGRAVCSLSMASGTGMLNIRTRQWDGELMDALGVRAEQLANLGDLHDKISGLTSTYASRWPALRNVPWFPAIGDGAAANVGSGCVSEGKFALTIGTSSAIRVVVAPGQVVPPPGLWLYLVDAKRALLGGALSEGGNIFAWLSKAVQIASLKEADSEVAKLPPDGHGLTILPFISGERSLGWHAEARAVIAGLHTHTSPFEMVRAASEALAYQLEAVYQQIKNTLNFHAAQPTLIASGGALLSSPSLQQIVADTLATPLYPTYEQEASARGAALLALEAMGVVSNVEQLAPELAEPVQPDAQRGAIYQQGALRQRQLYKALLGDMEG
ncbi:MAG: gluconokinase [Ktedonobacteraceae bacterium]